MLGLGLSLTVADFTRIVVYPKAVLVGLGCQMLLLPCVCFLVALGFGLQPELAVGLLLLAASPGGPSANLFSHLAKGDVALNITLTAVNSVLAIFWMPVVVNLSLAYFMGDDKTIPLQVGKVMQVFAIVVAPVAVGMLVRARAEAFATRLGKPVKVLSAVFLASLVVAAIAGERGNAADYLWQVLPAAFTFNVLSMMIGYNIPLLLGIPKRQAAAIGLEIGIHNGALAVAVASSPALLGNGVMAIPAAIYSVIMLFTAAFSSYRVSREISLES